MTDTPVPVEVWPELERAECLARGAALKWASGVFCRPEHLERLGQYRKRESQRTASIHSRLKVASDYFIKYKVCIELLHSFCNKCHLLSLILS